MRSQTNARRPRVALRLTIELARLVALLRRVDDKVAALLDEAEAPAQLANHLPSHRTPSQLRGRACSQLRVGAHPNAVWRRHGMEHDHLLIGPSVAIGFWACSQLGTGAHHNLFENRRLLRLRRVIVRLRDIHSSALHIWPIDPASVVQMVNEMRSCEI